MHAIMGATPEAMLGRTITEQRKLRGITQEELAELVDVSVETISRLERGRATPSLARLNRIAEALEVDVAELLKPAPRRPGSRADHALARLEALLRARSIRELEMIADVVERILRG